MNDLALTRRNLIGGMTLIAAAPAVAAEPTIRLIAGTYRNGGGKGLYPVTYTARGERWSVGEPIAGIEDASFGVLGGPADTRYFLRERSAGEVGAYGPAWARRGVAATGGADPCHAALDRASATLAIANYSSGSVAFHQLDPRTGIPASATVFAHRGSGPNADRQASPHAHWVGFSPDRQWLHAVDLGADAIFAYRFDRAARTLAEPVIAWAAPGGAGPRHLARHPRLPVAYVVCELSNMLIQLAVLPDGRFRTILSVSTLPAEFSGASQAAHIQVDAAGRRLYVSNRGHDSIAVFALDAQGAPSPIQHISSGGHWPRVFLLLERERRMIVANERAGQLAILTIGTDGKLGDTGQRLAVPGVVFLAQNE